MLMRYEFVLIGFAFLFVFILLIKKEKAITAEKKAQLLRACAEVDAAVDALFDFLKLDADDLLDPREIFSPREILGLVRSYGITVLDVAQLETCYREIIGDDADQRSQLGGYITRAAQAKGLAGVLMGSINFMTQGDADEDDNLFILFTTDAMDAMDHEAEAADVHAA
jgi:hypothetical protein